MCANYTPSRSDLIEAVTGLSLGFAVLPEVFPGQAAPLIRLTQDGEWQCIASSFGLVPTWAKDAHFARHTYNARSETADSKPSFRNAWKGRHIGLVPMSGFYEPCYETSGVVRWRIHRSDQAIFFAAALFEWRKGPTTEGLVSHTLLTVNADGHPLMQRFHKAEDEKRSIVTFDWADGIQWVVTHRQADSEIRQSLIPIDIDSYTAEPAAMLRASKSTPKHPSGTTRTTISKTTETNTSKSDKAKLTKLTDTIPKNRELF